MFEAITKNKFKTSIIVACVFIFFSIVIYYIAYATGYGSYAVPIALTFSFFASFFSYWYSDKLVLTMSNARPANDTQDKIVKNVLEGIVIAAGIPMPDIYVIDDPSPNAFATGRNPKHAVVCVTTGLLDMMDYYELEGVLAHEVAHIKNYDILLQTVVTIMVGTVVMISDIWTRSFWFGGNRRRKNDNEGAANVIIMVVGVVFLILAPIMGQLMKMSLSRNREYLADATAAEFTRNPEGLASALEKLGGNSRPVSSANNATACLYITDPIKKSLNGEQVSNLFSTHPPIEKRVAALRNLR